MTSKEIQSDKNILRSSVYDDGSDTLEGDHVNDDEADGGGVGFVTYSCEFCNQVFHSKGMHTIHVKKHTKPHECDVCGRGFAKNFTMQCHRKTHFNQKDHRCAMCGQAFTLRPQLNKHIGEKHGADAQLQCDACGARFLRRNVLERHQAHYCTGRSVDCEAVPKTGMLPMREEKSPVEHRCTECGEIADSIWALELHVRAHRKRYACTICENRYTERFMLQAHVLSAHVGIRPYRCLVCAAAFTMKAHCERHCRMHLRIQHFECADCGYMFRNDSDKQTHQTGGHCRRERDPKPDVR